MINSKRVIQNIIGNRKRGGRNDLDGDGVPNKKDCQQRNVMRQDAYGNTNMFFALRYNIMYPNEYYPMDYNTMKENIDMYLKLGKITPDEAQQLMQMLNQG